MQITKDLDRFFNAESTYDRLVRSENEIRKANADREHQDALQARRARECLENGIGPMEAPPKQANIVDALNGTVAQGDGLNAILNLRKMQELERKTPSQHNRFEKSAAFNRLHPDAEGHRFRRASRFDGDFRPGDDVTSGARGDRDDARDQRYVSELRAGKVRDAAGRLVGDNVGGRYWPAAGEPEGIDPAFLLEAARLLLEAVRRERAGYPRGRRDQT